MTVSPCRANRRAPNVSVLVFLLLALIAATPTSVVHAAALEDVLAAWRARQAKVRSLNCEWIQEELVPKGSVEPPRPGDVSPRPPEGAVIPPEDTELVCRFSFRLRNRDARYEEDGEHWSGATNKREPYHYINALLAGENRALFPKGISGFPGGTVYKSSPYPALTLHRNLRALKLVFRPLGPDFNGYDDARFTIASATAPFNGRDCHILSYVYLKGHEDEIWVDGSRQFVPVRYFMKRDGKIVTDLTITYEKSAGDWIPSIWIWKGMTLAGRLWEQFTADVSVCSINPSLSDKELIVEFPPGAWVHDQRSQESYILRKDGTKRMVRPGEGTKDYDAIMAEREGAK